MFRTIKIGNETYHGYKLAQASQKQAISFVHDIELAKQASIDIRFHKLTVWDSSEMYAQLIRRNLILKTDTLSAFKTAINVTQQLSVHNFCHRDERDFSKYSFAVDLNRLSPKNLLDKPDWLKTFLSNKTYKERTLMLFEIGALEIWRSNSSFKEDILKQIPEEIIFPLNDPTEHPEI